MSAAHRLFSAGIGSPSGLPLALLAFCLLSAPAHAQWTTPTVDGNIGNSEYGNNNQLMNAGNTGQTWYMTWDANNLYVGIVNATLSEAAVIYIGTGAANGSTSGFNYDGTDFASLPFSANFVTYVKDGYNEYRASTGGGWSSQTSNYAAYASNAGNTNTREFAIPWSAVNGGRGIPTSFVFFGYLTSSGGYAYGNAPSDNPGAFIGTSATYTQYFSITNTGNGTSTPPFSNEQPSGFPGSVTAGFTHDTFNPFYRSPAGAVPENTQVTLRFTTVHTDGIYGVMLRAYLFDTASGITTGPVDTNMPFDQNITFNGPELDAWKATVTAPSATTIYYYKFKVNRDTTNGWYSDDYLDGYDNLNKDGTGVTTNGEPFNSFEINVYDPNFQTPAWLQNANVYHIFPDRFRNGDQTNDYCRAGSTTGCPLYYGSQQAFIHNTWNEAICDPYNNNGPCPGAFSNQFFGGDLLGIQNQLDYIQSLGQDTIYLNPIFQARSNHRYDTDNYLHIDPALGGDAAFTALQQETNRRGMQLILDGVFNHSSSDGMYFDRYDRYGGTPPNIGACLSLQSMWRTWIHFNDNNVPCGESDYTGWFGLDSLPTWDHTQQAVKDFFYSGSPDNVTLHWYNLGASGWRFDVADDGNFPRPWWHAYRTYAKMYNSNGPLIGEIWPDAAQWLAGDQMDSVMNYRFRKNITGFVRNANWCDNNDNGTNCIVALLPSQFDHAIRAVRDDYPPQSTAAMLNLLDSHDVNRALYVMTELGDNGLVQAKQRLQLAALFQFTYIGAPMVMYGDEVAINSPSLANTGSGPIGDPYTRAPYPWTDQSGDPTVYGPPDTNVLSYYKLLAHMRKQYPLFRTGAFTTLLTGDTQQPGTAANTYAFARTLNGSSAVVAMNNGSSSNNATIPVTGIFADSTQLQDVISGNTYSVSGGNVTVTLPAIGGVILLPYPASVDLAAPIASASLTPAANGAGWNNTSPVTVNLSASDTGGSGVSQLRFWTDGGAVGVFNGSSTTTSVSGEGMHTTSLRALDNAGNISALVTQTINIDLTPPVVSVTGVTNHASYPYGGVPVAGCSTSDALSGVASAASLALTETTSPGYATYTATCSGAADKAGNAAQPVTATYTVTFTGSVPASGATCNGSYDGTFKGNITVSKGQNCVFVYGGATGNVIETGGSLTLTSATVGGNVQVSGGTVTMGASTISGNLQVQNLPSSAAQNQVCGATVKGNLQYQNNAAGAEIGGPSCAGNTISGNLQVQNNTAATLLVGNIVSGNLQDQNNTAPTQVTGNTVASNLQCENNTSITGGGNTAKQKQGQCATF